MILVVAHIDLKKNEMLVSTTYSGRSGQAAQPIPLASHKLSMAMYGQKLDGRPSR